jgi:hypothetical protein
VIFVNGIDTLKDVFVKKEAYFSDRPDVYFFTHIKGRKGMVNKLCLNIVEGRRDLIQRNAIIQNIKSAGIIPTLNSSSAAIFYFVGKRGAALRYNSHLI